MTGKLITYGGVPLIVIGLFVLAIIFLGRLGSQSVSGSLEGERYGYWQRSGCCRELTLYAADGSEIIIYDKNDDNIIGNHDLDSYKVIKANGYGYVRYSSGGIETRNWDGETLDKDKALEQATNIFQEKRAKIVAQGVIDP